MRGWGSEVIRIHPHIFIIRPLSNRSNYIIQFINPHQPQSASSICEIIIIIISSSSSSSIILYSSLVFLVVRAQKCIDLG